ncbi:MAG TPA: DUF1996 domain-containing protein [Actinomycetota bacterium]
MPRFLRSPRRSTRRTTIVALAAVALVVLAVHPTAGARGLDRKAGWVVRCSFVRHLRADPIVYPRLPGASHLHAFFGNEGTDAYSTYRSLRRDTTSCGLMQDTAAYWIPAVYDDGRRVEPMIAAFYYRNRVAPARSVRPFPKGLEIIAGHADATEPPPTSVVYWDCDGGGSDANLDHPVDCGATGVVSANIRFPDCWDGRRTESANHHAHMAYSIDPDDDGSFRCPATHPVPVPRLTYSLRFPIHDGTRLTLSSGPPRSMHADFINAWAQRKLRRLVQRCIKAQVNCGAFGLGQ